MNVQEYIASGILEQYVLGILSAEEHEKVFHNAQKYPSIQAEINAYEDALLKYAQASAIPLRPNLSTQILNAIDTLILKSSSIGKSGSSFNWLAVSLGVLLLVTASFAFYSLQERNNLEQQLETSQVAFQDLQNDCNKTNALVEQLSQKLNILHSVGNNTTSMKALNAEDEQIIAYIHRDLEAGTAHLDIDQLPAPPEGKQYQLWYIVEKTPQSMGVFDLNTDFIPVDFIENAIVFAISLEDEGGSPAPTNIRFLGEVG